MLVMSVFALDCKQYNTNDTKVTWETCSLRQWLNNEFIDNAFFLGERMMIPTVTVPADKNPEYSTNPGNDTKDAVFLLSRSECNQYSVSPYCFPTDYAISRGVELGGYGSPTNCWWFLRTPGDTQAYVCAASPYGDIRDHVRVGERDRAVRPVLWIDLSAIE